ncbi:PASTA domain-containing protein [bacterium]|nr:PASTA domain-containing protein [bacterium]
MIIKSVTKLLLYLAAFAALGVLAVFLVFQVMDFKQSGDVPDLTGKSVTEAAEILSKKKLLLGISGKEYHDEIAEGHVISQMVSPGGEAAAGTEIGVKVSLGGEVYSLPSFEGQRLENAKLSLVNLGIKGKKITWVYTENEEKGTIISQRPLPGDIRSNEINFLVSQGAKDIEYNCPSFVKMNIEDARELARAMGIKLKELKQGDRIIMQQVEAGALIKKGETMEVTLGRGPGVWF